MSVTAVSKLLLQKLDSACQITISTLPWNFSRRFLLARFCIVHLELITLEGRDEIRDMLEARLADVRPVNWEIDEEHLAQQDGPVSQGFIRFETQQAHGYGYIRVEMVVSSPFSPPCKTQAMKNRAVSNGHLVSWKVSTLSRLTWGERREQSSRKSG